MIEKDVERINGEMIADGTIDKLIRDELTKAYTKIVADCFSTWKGNAGKVIEDKINDAILKSVEGLNWENYIPKMDAVLTDIVNGTAAVETKDILEKFKYLMVEPDKKSINVTDLFKEYKSIVAAHADPDGHDVEFDSGEPEYEPISVEYIFEKQEKPRWSSIERGIITLKTDDTDTNDTDKNLNIEIPVSRWDFSREEGYEIECSSIVNIKNIRYLSDLDLMVMKLSRAGTRIVIDKEYDDDVVYFNDKPEASWS